MKNSTQEIAMHDIGKAFRVKINYILRKQLKNLSPVGRASPVV